MQRVLLIIFSLFFVVGIYAQDSTTTGGEESRPVKEYLSSFTSLEVDAPIKLKLTKIAEGEAPYIIYDTKGNYTSKFTAEVDRKAARLKISERSDSKRVSITEVQLFFNTLTDISISKADTQIEGVLTSKLLDFYISNAAHVEAEVDVLDLMVFASGKSRIVLKGSTHYQTVDVSSAEYDAQHLGTIATVADVAHNAVVRVDATERLEVKTSTGGKLYYYSQPVILRSEIAMFGGEIVLKQ